jgi:GT2 family glycosyltransferase
MSTALDDLDVIFLVWREAPAMLARHHAAVAAALPPGWAGTALQVENAGLSISRRAGRELIGRHHPHATRRALELPRNMGFGRAMNLAIGECSGRYVALVNSDGRPEPGMFATLVAALEADPRAVWAAPAVHGPGEGDEPPGPAYEEEVLAGMALVMRRERFLALGGFDPLFFFYNEDFDASRRIRDAGGRLIRVPDARFHHGKGGRSARGRLVREFWFALTDQTFVHRHESSRARAVARLVRGRRRSLTHHLRARDLPAVAGIAGATLAWPVTTAAAEWRRRRPWSAAALSRWRRRHRPEARLVSISDAVSSTSGSASGSVGAGGSSERYSPSTRSASESQA